jgi:hypothetical protein
LPETGQAMQRTNKKHRYHPDHARLAEGQFRPQRINGIRKPPPELDEWDISDEWNVEDTGDDQN